MVEWLDRFLHEGTCHRKDSLYRARIQLGVIAITTLLTWGYLIYVAAFSPLTGDLLAFSIGLLVPLAVLFPALLLLLKKIPSHRVVTHMLVAMTWVPMLVAVAVTGGPMASPGNYALFVPLVLAFCLGGRSVGISWALIIMSAQFLLLMFMENAVSIPQFELNGAMGSTVLMNWTLAFLVTLGVLMIYEAVNSSLRVERDEEHLKLLHIASHDQLTGIGNRAKLEEDLANACSRADRYGGTVALLYLDLDRFKPINDNYGHKAGDYVLQVVAERLREGVRKVDSVARLGGDEFAVVLDRLSEPADIAIVSRKLKLLVETAMIYDGHEINVGVSIGYSLYPQDNRDTHELLSLADKAMYRDKQGDSLPIKQVAAG